MYGGSIYLRRNMIENKFMYLKFTAKAISSEKSHGGNIEMG